jgi:hypothetical protein
MGSTGRCIGSGDDVCEDEADVDEGADEVVVAGAIDDAPPTAPIVSTTLAS